MVYVISALGIPTIACMVHARVQGDERAFRGGFVFLGVVAVLGLIALAVAGVD